MIATGHNDGFSAAVHNFLGNPAYERPPPSVGEKLVVRSEPLRGSCSQKDGTNLRHYTAPRATFASSARIETAISAGPFAPIANPTGARMRASSESPKPAVRSRSKRLACVFLEPRAPIYRQSDRNAALTASSSSAAAWVKATTVVLLSSPKALSDISGQSVSATASPMRSGLANA